MYQVEQEQEEKQKEREEYSYGYLTCEIQKCYYCNKWIECKFCPFLLNGKILYFHRKCLYKFYTET